jgi:predicted DNA-binding transcriptional regulator AlpA
MSKSIPKPSTIEAAPPSDRLLSRAEVLEIIGVTYPTLWWWVKEGDFPAPRTLGFKKGPRGRIGWVESEVQSWIMSRPKRFPKGTKLTEVA